MPFPAQLLYFTTVVIRSSCFLRDIPRTTWTHGNQDAYPAFREFLHADFIQDHICKSGCCIQS